MGTFTSTMTVEGTIRDQLLPSLSYFSHVGTAGPLQRHKFRPARLQTPIRHYFFYSV